MNLTLTWQETIVGEGHSDIDLLVEGEYFGTVCTANRRFDPNDFKVLAVVNARRKAYFETVGEARAWLEFEANADAYGVGGRTAGRA